jgi:hypothetical protein
MMAAKRRTTADFLAEQRAIVNADADAGEARAGLASVRDADPLAPAAADVPEPYAWAGDGPLAAVEQADLATCEAALDNLRVAFWAAGKALQAIRDARLYRYGYDTFEDYVEQRWDVRRAQAYRLIAAWPLAERLSPIGDKITESQIRELLPVSDDHGEDAAEVVYQAVAETDGVTITAARLRQVVAILPAGPFDAEKAVAQIRAYLAGELTLPAPSPAGPGRAFAVTASRLAKALQCDAAPDVVHKAVAELRAMLDEIDREHGITT